LTSFSLTLRKDVARASPFVFASRHVAYVIACVHRWSLASLSADISEYGVSKYARLRVRYPYLVAFVSAYTISNTVFESFS